MTKCKFSKKCKHYDEMSHCCNKNQFKEDDNPYCGKFRELSKVLVVMFAFIFVINFALAGTSLSPPVAQYRLNTQNFSSMNQTQVIDSMGLNNGTLVGKTFNNGAVINSGNVTTTNNVMNFNGFIGYSNSSISSINVSQTGVTLSAWVYVSENKTANTILSLGNVTTNIEIYLATNSSQTTSEYGFRATCTGCDDTFTSGSQPLPTLNTWYYVTLVHNGTYFITYVNGVQAIVDSSSFSITPLPNFLKIGAQNGLSALRFMNGSINNVLIYNRSLSASEIAQIYALGKDEYTNISDGLVAQYSGRDYAGSSDAPTTIYDTNHLVKGKINQGFGFDGVNDYVNSSVKDLNSDLTFSLWYKASSLNPSGTTRALMGIRDGTGNNRMYLGHTNSVNKLAMIVGATGETIQTSYAVNVSQWYHVVGTYVNSTGLMNLYVDGIFINSSTKLRNNSNMYYFIGANANSVSAPTANTFINGSIDDVRIYNRSLSATEIAMIYADGEGVYYTNLSTMNVTNIQLANGTVLTGTNITVPENANVTFTATGVDTQNYNSTWFAWLVDGIQQLAGFGQNIFNYVFNNKVENPTSNVTMVANDTTGQIQQDFTVNTQTQSPNLNLISPINGTIYNTSTSNISINFSSSDLNINTCWYNVNGGVNNTITCNTNISYLVTDGLNIINYYVNDSVNNVNSSSLYVYGGVYLMNISNSTYYVLDVNGSSNWGAIENLTFNSFAPQVDSFNWYVDGVSKLSGNNQTRFNYLFSAPVTGQSRQYNVTLVTNATSQSFFINVLNPIVVNMTYPLDGSTQYSNIVQFNVTANITKGSSYLTNVSLWTNSSGSWTMSNVTSYSPAIIPNPHNQTINTLQGSDSKVYGMEFTARKNIYLFNVTKDSASSPTICALYYSNGTNLKNGTFSGNNCELNVNLIGGQTYWIMGSKGGSSWDFYRSTTGGFPLTSADIFWNGTSQDANSFAVRTDIAGVFTNINTGTIYTTVTSLWNVSIPQGFSYWYAEACDTNNDCYYPNMSASILLDPIAPNINLNYPTSLISYGGLGQPLQLNITVNDTNLDKVWYDYNGTNITISGAKSGISNISNITLTTKKNVTIYANDTAGNLNSTMFSWDYKVFENSQTYTATTYPRVSNAFTVNVTSQNLSSIKINYNGTNYTTNSYASGNNTIGTVNILAPLISADTNISFYWLFILNDGTVINSNSFNQLIRYITVGNNYSNLIYNITVRNEETNNIIPNNNVTMNYEVTYGYDNSSILGTNLFADNKLTNKNISSNINASFYLKGTITYTADLFIGRTYYFTENNISSPSNITLYLSYDNQSYVKTILVTDEAGRGKPALFKQYRMINGVKSLVASEQLDSTGKSTISFIPNVQYIFEFQNTGCTDLTKNIIFYDQSDYTQVLSCSTYNPNDYVDPFEGSVITFYPDGVFNVDNSTNLSNSLFSVNVSGTSSFCSNVNVLTFSVYNQNGVLLFSDNSNTCDVLFGSGYFNTYATGVLYILLDDGTEKTVNYKWIKSYSNTDYSNYSILTLISEVGNSDDILEIDWKIKLLFCFIGLLGVIISLTYYQRIYNFSNIFILVVVDVYLWFMCYIGWGNLNIAPSGGGITALVSKYGILILAVLGTAGIIATKEDEYS